MQLQKLDFRFSLSIRLALALMLAVALIPLSSGVISAPEAPNPLFQSNEILDITLTAPFGLIDRERDKEQKYDATLSYQDSTGQTSTQKISLKVRGNNRLRKDLCKYSQLWIDFKKKTSRNTIFEGQDEVKLVVQCRGQDRYQDYIAKELQAYQLFNELTELSFATRAVRVTYVDSDKSGASRTQLAFFIEHQEQLAERRGMREFKDQRIPLEKLDPLQSSLVSLFMYMVSNVDYSMVQGAPGDNCCHNTKLLESTEGTYYPIPYDFDATGYVDTSYAVPSEALHQRNVKQRVYRGFCVSEDIMAETLATFRQQRVAMEGIIGNTSLVTEKIASKSLEFMEDFYDVINDPAKLQKEIIGKCRG